jgi:hypothetical protein
MGGLFTQIEALPIAGPTLGTCLPPTIPVASSETPNELDSGARPPTQPNISLELSHRFNKPGSGSAGLYFGGESRETNTIPIYSMSKRVCTIVLSP